MSLSFRLSTRRFGELLLERGWVTPDQLAEALRSRQDPRERLGQTLVRLGVLEERNVTELLGEQFSLAVVGPERLAQADPAAVQLVPEHLARQAMLLALKREGDTLDVAVGDPLDVVSLDHLRALTGCTLRVCLARPAEVREAIDNFYQEIRASENLGEILDKLDLSATTEEEDVDLAALRQQVEDAPVVRLVNLMLAEAIDARASDIHVEPLRDRITVRFRIDGALHEVMKPPKNLQMAIVSRIKVLADLDIAVRLLPQDGRLTVHLPDREVDIRVSTLPTAFGEKVVLRLFDKKAFTREIEHLGLDGSALESFRRAVHLPYGMILVSGPTGSGKTTTLYAALGEIKTVSKNLISVEDPIEYHIETVNQVHANHKVGMTFARALRSILRQDPDVIMVGEIRDGETAGISVQAALTGHRVLSTVHTNDAAGAITRLIDMGIERFLVSSVLLATFAQRLVRTICPYCVERYRPNEKVIAAWGLQVDGANFQRGRGCPACMGTGYRGRTGIFEIVLNDEEVQDMILRGMAAQEISRILKQKGKLRTLKDDAMSKVLSGVTTIEEASAAVMV